MANYVGGKNLGRRICASQEALLYDLTGRSEGSRNRVIVPVTNYGCEFGLLVKSRSKLSPKDSDILEYPCIMKMKNDGIPEDMYLLSNGVHVRDIAAEAMELLEDSGPHNDDDYKLVIEKWLQHYGVEPDGKTPRIVAVIIKEDEHGEFDTCHFGSIYPDENGKPRNDGLVPGTVKTISMDLEREVMFSLATYTAKEPDLEPSKCVIGRHARPVIPEEASAQWLAEWEYEQLKEYFVEEEKEGQVDTRVATAAVVLDDTDMHHIGYHNRHKLFQSS